jgi:hypothetical protein
LLGLPGCLVVELPGCQIAAPVDREVRALRFLDLSDELVCHFETEQRSNLPTRQPGQPGNPGN